MSPKQEGPQGSIWQSTYKKLLIIFINYMSYSCPMIVSTLWTIVQLSTHKSTQRMYNLYTCTWINNLVACLRDLPHKAKIQDSFTKISSYVLNYIIII